MDSIEETEDSDLENSYAEVDENEDPNETDTEIVVNDNTHDGTNLEEDPNDTDTEIVVNDNTHEGTNLEDDPNNTDTEIVVNNNIDGGTNLEEDPNDTDTEIVVNRNTDRGTNLEEDPNQNDTELVVNDGSDEGNDVRTQSCHDAPSSSRKCDCSTKVLCRIAEQLRAQASTLKPPGQEVLPNMPFEEKIANILNATMSVLQTEMANLMEVYIDSDNTTFTCTHPQANLTETNVNLEKPPDSPGDNVNVKASADILCECHPTHAGAAPPVVESHDAVNLVIPINSCPNMCIHSGSANVNKGTTESMKYQNKTQMEDIKGSSKCGKSFKSGRSSNYSRIPVPSGCGHSSKTRKKTPSVLQTCCVDKSAGVQTVLTLGKRLQSESLNSLSGDENCRVKSSCQQVTLRSSRCYNIELSGKESSKVIKIDFSPFKESWSSTGDPLLNTTNNAPVNLKQSPKSTITITITKSKPRVGAKRSHSCPNMHPHISNTMSSKSTSCCSTKSTQKMSLRNSEAKNVQITSVPTSSDNSDALELDSVTAIPADLDKDALKNFSPAKCSCTNNKFDTYSADPVMIAMETCETELRPLRRAFTELQQKVRNMKVSELKGCFCETLLEQTDTDKEEKPLQSRCARFTPAKLDPARILPYGKLHFPTVSSRPPIELNAPHTSNVTRYPVTNSPRRHQHNHCRCKQKNRAVDKKDKETQHRVAIDPDNIASWNRNYYASSMYNSTPFYANSVHPMIYHTSTERNPLHQDGFRSKFKNTIKHGRNEVIEQESCDNVIRQRKTCRQKISPRMFSKSKKKNYTRSSSTSRIRCCRKEFDIQNLQFGQAVKTDPDDFLQPKNKFL